MQLNSFSNRLILPQSKDLLGKFQDGKYRLFLANILTLPHELKKYLLEDKEVLYLSNILDGLPTPQLMADSLESLLSFLQSEGVIICSVVKSDMFTQATQILRTKGIRVLRNVDFGLPESIETVQKPYHIDDFAVIQINNGGI